VRADPAAPNAEVAAATVAGRLAIGAQRADREDDGGTRYISGKFQDRGFRTMYKVQILQWVVGSKLPYFLKMQHPERLKFGLRD